jgi:hypothetical protein
MSPSGQRQGDVPIADGRLLLLVGLRRVGLHLQPDVREPGRVLEDVDGLAAIVGHSEAGPVAVTPELPVDKHLPRPVVELTSRTTSDGRSRVGLIAIASHLL